MLAVADVAPSQRRLAATDATVAIMFAVAGARACKPVETRLVTLRMTRRARVWIVLERGLRRKDHSSLDAGEHAKQGGAVWSGLFGVIERKPSLMRDLSRSVVFGL